MNVTYLMSGYALAVLLVLIGLRVGSRSVPGMQGVSQLSWSLISALAALILLALRPIAPAWATILLANEALFVSSLLIYWATARVLDARAQFLSWGLGILPVALAVNGYFTYLRPNLTARILLDTSVTGIYASAATILLLRYRDADEDRLAPGMPIRSLAVALGCLKLAIVVQDLLRCVLTFLYPPANFTTLGLIQAGYTYSNMVLSLGAVCGLVWLAFLAHRRGLQRMAQTDGLTGLLNRRAFEDVLGRELQRSQHGQGSLAVLLLDLDHFKQINDLWGHPAGDEVLRRVALALRESMRAVDALCRFGGEEFVVLLRETGIDQAEEIAWRLRTVISELAHLPGDARITASIGVAASHPVDTVDQILGRCDEALYASKRAGRNQVTVERIFTQPVQRPQTARDPGFPEPA